MLIVVHYCYRFLCTVVTDSCALLLPFFVHSPYHFLCTRDFCLQHRDAHADRGGIADPGQPGRGDDTGNNPGVVEPCLA